MKSSGKKDDECSCGSNEYICFCNSCDDVYLITSKHRRKSNRAFKNARDEDDETECVNEESSDVCERIFKNIFKLDKLLVRIFMKKLCISNEELDKIKRYLHTLEDCCLKDRNIRKCFRSNKNDCSPKVPELVYLNEKAKRIYKAFRDASEQYGEPFKRPCDLLNFYACKKPDENIDSTDFEEQDDDAMYMNKKIHERCESKNRKLDFKFEEKTPQNVNRMPISKKKFDSIGQNLTYDLQNDKYLKFPKQTESDAYPMHEILIENYKKFYKFMKCPATPEDRLDCIPGIGPVYSERLRKHVRTIPELIDAAAVMEKSDFKQLLKCYANMNSYYSELVYLSLMAHYKKYGCGSPIRVRDVRYKERS